MTTLLWAVTDRLMKEYGHVRVIEPSLYDEGKINSPHPSGSLAKIMNIIRYYTNSWNRLCIFY